MTMRDHWALYDFILDYLRRRFGQWRDDNADAGGFLK